MSKKLKYKRIMLKISGEVLEGSQGQGIDFKVLDELCREVAGVKKLGVEIAVVIGGGNFWRYRDFKESGLDHVHSDYMGMLSTVMNAIAMQHSLKKAGVDSRPLSAIPMQQVVGTYLRDKALDYLERGKIVICGGGTGNPFFTTDSAAALRALELSCNVLLKATKVDYVYDKDPMKFKNAKSYRKISYDEVFKQELEVMDLSAIDLCAKSKLPVIVFNLKKKGNIARAVKGEAVGTLIS
jgi:uridylate kinase